MRLMIGRTQKSAAVATSANTKRGREIAGELYGHVLDPRTGRPASELARSFEPVPQLLRNVRFGAGTTPLEAPGVQAAISEAEARLGHDGRLLIRKSGTEPLIRVMAEAEDEGLMVQVVGDIIAAVEAAA